MRPTIGRCSNRITSKTSILTLNEQRNLQPNSPYTMIDRSAPEFVQIISSRPKNFHRAAFAICVMKTRRTDLVARQGGEILRRGRTYPISVKILVKDRSRRTRANGVAPVGRSDSFKAACFPLPEASIQACRAAAMAGNPSVTRSGGGLGE